MWDLPREYIHDLADGVIAFFFECIVNLYEHLLHIELLRRLNAECLGAVAEIFCHVEHLLVFRSCKGCKNTVYISLYAGPGVLFAYKSTVE